AFRRLLASADRFSDRAIRFGSLQENTPESRSRELLVSVTCRDQRLGEGFVEDLVVLRAGILVGRPAQRMIALGTFISLYLRPYRFDPVGYSPQERSSIREYSPDE